MELKHLYTFLKLSEIKNFTRTAEYLHYAQSNVTAQIHQLEEELGARLFDRIGKNISLTSEGKELIVYARQMLNLSNQLKQNFINKNDHGRITIGASESICIYRLPKIIRAYQIDHPNVEIYLNVLDTSDFISLLANNTIDIAFILDIPIHNSSIITALQINEDICAFSTPEYSLSQKSKVEIEDFSDIPLILTSRECCYRKMFEKDLFEAGIKPKVVLETSSLQVIKQTTLSGLGVCVLPQLSVQKELDEEELAKIHYATNYKITSQLIYHKDKWISNNLQDFIATAQNLL